MQRLLHEIISESAYWLALCLTFLPDAVWLVALRGLHRLVTIHNNQDFRGVVVGDIIKIFSNRKSAKLARKMIRKARRNQFKALVRGQLW